MIPLDWEWIALFFTLSVAVKAPMWLKENLFYYDTIEYMSLGRRLAEGRGFELPIKAYFKTDIPVVHSPLRDVCRPPLYPLLIGGLWRLRPSVILIQFAGVMFSFGTAVLCALAARLAFGETAGLLAGVAAALVPDLFILSNYPMTEPLVSLLSAAIALCTIKLSMGGGWFWGILAGAALGAFIWTRPNGQSLVVAWAVACLQGTSLGHGGWIAAFLGLGSLAAYSWFVNARVSSSERFDILVAHLHARLPGDLVWMGHRWQASVALSAIRRAPLSTAFDIAKFMAKALPLLPGPRLFSLAGIIGLTLAGPGAPGWVHLGLLALANFATSYCVPATGTPTRYLMPSFFFLLPIACGGVMEIESVPLRWGLVALWLIPFLGWDGYHAIRFRNQEKRPYLSRYEAVGAWLDKHAGPEDVIGASDPWLVHWSSHRPAVLIPFFDRADEMRPFLDRHGVRWIIHDAGFPQYSWCSAIEQWPGAGIQALEKGQWTGSVLRQEFEETGGNIRVYEIRP